MTELRGALTAVASFPRGKTTPEEERPKISWTPIVEVTNEQVRMPATTKDREVSSRDSSLKRWSAGRTTITMTTPNSTQDPAM